MAPLSDGGLPSFVALAGMSAGGDPLADFDYILPPHLIADRPPATRDGGRLLDLTGKKPVARKMTDFPALLRAGDVLAVNDSRVIPARLIGKKTTGGRVEILAERILGENILLAQARPSRGLQAGTVIQLDSAPDAVLRAEKRVGELWEFSSDLQITDLLHRAGEIPLPPYIRRKADAADAERYQTIFARQEGSVAAPTAGLHFSEEMRRKLELGGVEIVSLTLHVGAGTFAPIRSHPDSHKMHSERFCIPAKTAEAVCRAKKESRRVIAAGTTTLRALESWALQSGDAARSAERAGGSGWEWVGETDLFIRSGFAFRAADLLLTNFHLPRSTLLMLACAFGGRERVLAGYDFGVKNAFRFFSYGDATLLSRD